MDCPICKKPIEKDEEAIATESGFVHSCCSWEQAKKNLLEGVTRHLKDYLRTSEDTHFHNACVEMKQHIEKYHTLNPWYLQCPLAGIRLDAQGLSQQG